jgi:hypothetical protein
MDCQDDQRFSELEFIGGGEESFDGLVVRCVKDAVALLI